MTHIEPLPLSSRARLFLGLPQLFANRNFTQFIRMIYVTYISSFAHQVIDLLVRLLQIPLEGAIDQTHLTRVFKAAYDVLYTYMIGNSRKNALYFAKYIDFFQTQISVKVSCLQMYLSIYQFQFYAN